MGMLIDTSHWLRMAQSIMAHGAVLDYIADCRQWSAGIGSGDQFCWTQEASGCHLLPLGLPHTFLWVTISPQSLGSDI